MTKESIRAAIEVTLALGHAVRSELTHNMKKHIDPSVARAASAQHYHCDLSSIDPSGQHEDLGPYRSLLEMTFMTGKSISQWRAERKALAQAKALRKRQRAAGTPKQPKVDMLALLMAS